MLTLVRIILLSLLLFGVAADVFAADCSSTIFSSCEKATARPVYSLDSSVREQVRSFTEGTIPGPDQIKMLPSLANDQRKKLDEVFERLKSESQHLQQELQTVRPQLNELMLRRVLEGARNGVTTFDDKAIDLPVKLNGKEVDRSKSLSTMSRATELLIKLRDLRSKAWQDVQIILSARQLEELAAMRRGELLSPILTASGGSDASNLGDEDMPGMVGMPMSK